LRRGEIKIEGLGKRYWFRSDAPKEGDDDEQDTDDADDDEEEDGGRSGFYFGPRTEVWALRDLFCHIEPGERIAVIGVNGCGKSTLLRILSRTLPPSEGTVEGVGSVIPFEALAGPISGQNSGCDNLRMIARLLGLPLGRLEERLPEIIEFSELGALAYEKVGRYSSKSFNRLSFSMALYMEADIYLIDDGLGVPDPIYYKKFLQKFAEVLDQNRTLIFSSNNLNELKRYCRRALWLDRGKLVADGEFDKTVEQYLSHRDTPQPTPEPKQAAREDIASSDSELEEPGTVEPVLSIEEHRKARKRAK
jgi:ABC-type polysaccharide/polyol phosphate transport system ATPase subunit